MHIQYSFRFATIDMTGTRTPQILFASITVAAASAFLLRKKRGPIIRSAEDVIASSPTAADMGFPEKTEFGSFTNKDGILIHTLSLKACTKSKASALFIHGISEHSSRPGYCKLYDALSKKGVDVYAMDHRGHGLSGGERGYFENFEDAIDDLETFLHVTMHKNDGSLPLYLIGQSMGGNLAAQIALRLSTSEKPPAGLVMLSPMCGVDFGIVLKIQDALGDILDKFVPKVAIVDGVRPTDLSRDEKEVENYKHDPLIVHGKIKLHTALCLKAGFESLAKKKEGINCPVLLLHGTDDKTTSLTAALDFFDNISTPKEEKR